MVETIENKRRHPVLIAIKREGAAFAAQSPAIGNEPAEKNVVRKLSLTEQRDNKFLD
jgi:hypothetical protein